MMLHLHLPRSSKPKPTSPQYITNEQLQQVLKQYTTEIQQKMDNLYHGVQTRDNRVQNLVKQWEAAAKAQGVELNDSQRKLMADTALIETIKQTANTTQPPAPVPGQGQAEGNVDQQLIERVNQTAYNMQLVAGVTIEDSDPEISILAAAENGTPKEYLDAIQKAINAKQARTAGSPNVAPTQAAPGAPKSPGLVKGVPQSNPISNINDPDELWKLTKFRKG